MKAFRKLLIEGLGNLPSAQQLAIELAMVYTSVMVVFMLEEGSWQYG